MKSKLILTLFFLGFSGILSAQELPDRITTIYGDSINCWITDQRDDALLYRYVHDQKWKKDYIYLDEVKEFSWESKKQKLDFEPTRYLDVDCYTPPKHIGISLNYNYGFFFARTDLDLVLNNRAHSIRLGMSVFQRGLAYAFFFDDYESNVNILGINLAHRITFDRGRSCTHFYFQYKGILMLPNELHDLHLFPEVSPGLSFRINRNLKASMAVNINLLSPGFSAGLEYKF